MALEYTGFVIETADVAIKKRYVHPHYRYSVTFPALGLSFYNYTEQALFKQVTETMNDLIPIPSTGQVQLIPMSQDLFDNRRITGKLTLVTQPKIELDNLRQWLSTFPAPKWVTRI